MKRITRYGLVGLQIFLIVGLVYQFEQIERTGTEIKLQTTIDYLFEPADVQVDYAINNVPSDLWQVEQPIEYRELVYVTLVENKAGLFEIKTVTEKKPTKQTDEEVVLQAHYMYEDEVEQKHYVHYGFEYIENLDQFGQFQEGDAILVTILLGKLGQQKITKVELY